MDGALSHQRRRKPLSSKRHASFPRHSTGVSPGAQSAVVHRGNRLGPRPRHRGDDGHFQPGRCRTPSAAAVPRRASAGHDLRTVGAEPEKFRGSGDLRRLARFNEDLERRRRHRGHRPDPDSERRRGAARVGAARKCHAIVLYGAWSDAACRPRTRSEQRVFSRSIRRWGGDSASGCGATASRRIRRLSDRPSALGHRLVPCRSWASCRRPFSLSVRPTSGK